MNYYLFDNQEVKGPFSLSTIEEMVNAGELKDDVLVAAEGTDDWVPVAQLASAENGSAGDGGCPQSATSVPIDTPCSAQLTISSFYCSYCGTKLTDVPTDAGDHTTCPSCGQELAIPTNLAQSAVKQPQSPSPSPNPRPGGSSAERASIRVSGDASPAPSLGSLPTEPTSQTRPTPIQALQTGVESLPTKWTIAGCLALALVLVVAIKPVSSENSAGPSRIDAVNTAPPSSTAARVDLSQMKRDIELEYRHQFPDAICRDLDKEYKGMRDLVSAVIPGIAAVVDIYPEYAGDLQQIRDLQQRMDTYNRLRQQGNK